MHSLVQFKLSFLYCKYLADIGDLVVLMAKRRYVQHTDDNVSENEDSNEVGTRRVVSINPKMICHVFESEEVSFNCNIRRFLICLFKRHNQLLIQLDKHFKWHM